MVFYFSSGAWLFSRVGVEAKLGEGKRNGKGFLLS